jgi:CheY-like chemotaxis protein
MARDNLLLVDPNQDSAAVLALCLKQAGYSVATAHDVEEARSIITNGQPDLVLVDTALGNDGAFKCFAETRSDAATTEIPFIFITEPGELNHHQDALRPDHSDCLFKPVLVKEVTAKVALVLEKKKRNRWARRDSARTRFSGRLEDWSVVDLLQTIDMCKKSGELILETPWGTGQVWFTDGQLLDAALGSLQGDAAVYRMLALDSGAFVVEFKPIRRVTTIRQATQALLLEGLRRVDETNRLREQLPRMDLKLYPTPPDAQIFEDRPLSHTQRGTLSRFNGGRSPAEVLDHPGSDELETLKAITELYFAGYLTVEPTVAVMVTVEEESARAQSSRRLRGQAGFSTTGPQQAPVRTESATDLPPPPEFLEENEEVDDDESSNRHAGENEPKWRVPRPKRPHASTASILGTLEQQLTQIEDGVDAAQITEPYPPAIETQYESEATRASANQPLYAAVGDDISTPIHTPRPRPRTLLFEEAKLTRTTVRPPAPPPEITPKIKNEEGVPIRRLPADILEISGRHRVRPENGASAVRRIDAAMAPANEPPPSASSTTPLLHAKNRLLQTLPTLAIAYVAGLLTLLAIRGPERSDIQTPPTSAQIESARKIENSPKTETHRLAALPDAWLKPEERQTPRQNAVADDIDALATALVRSPDPSLIEAAAVIQSLISADRTLEAIALARWGLAHELTDKCRSLDGAPDICASLSQYVRKVAKTDNPERLSRKQQGESRHDPAGPVLPATETWHAPLRQP